MTLTILAGGKAELIYYFRRLSIWLSHTGRASSESIWSFFTSSGLYLPYVADRRATRGMKQNTTGSQSLAFSLHRLNSNTYWPTSSVQVAVDWCPQDSLVVTVTRALLLPPRQHFPSASPSTAASITPSSFFFQWLYFHYFLSLTISKGPFSAGTLSVSLPQISAPISHPQISAPICPADLSHPTPNPNLKSS